MYSLKHMAALLIRCARRRGGFSQHCTPTAHRPSGPVCYRGGTLHPGRNDSAGLPHQSSAPSTQHPAPRPPCPPAPSPDLCPSQMTHLPLHSTQYVASSARDSTHHGPWHRFVNVMHALRGTLAAPAQPRRSPIVMLTRPRHDTGQPRLSNFRLAASNICRQQRLRLATRNASDSVVLLDYHHHTPDTAGQPAPGGLDEPTAMLSLTPPHSRAAALQRCTATATHGQLRCGRQYQEQYEPPSPSS